MIQLQVHEAFSGISGSISLVAWIFVLLPQLIENYRLKSAQGVSLAFLTIWLIGDVTNLIGAIFAHLVPTVIALAVYFCISDFILITQCLYYQNIVKEVPAPTFSVEQEDADCREPLLRQTQSNIGLPGSRRGSSPSFKRSHYPTQDPSPFPSDNQRTLAKGLIIRILTLVAVVLLGTLGWFLAYQTRVWEPVAQDYDRSAAAEPMAAIVLGYTSALCYLGARIPQIVKNFREKSCDGLALLFFLLSILGNLTYGGGILFHSVDREYLRTNLPWLLGSLGTMAEDIIIFIQFRLYAKSYKDVTNETHDSRAAF